MRRILHPDLKRGAMVESAAVVLLFTLLAVLLVSVIHGVHSLPA